MGNDIYSNGDVPDRRNQDRRISENRNERPFRVNLPENLDDRRAPKGRPVGHDSYSSQPVTRPTGIRGEGRVYDIHGMEYQRERLQQQDQRRNQRPPQGRPPYRGDVRSSSADVYSEGRRPVGNNGGNRGKGGKGKGKKIAAAILCIILAAIIGLGGYAYVLVSKINYDTSTSGVNEYISDSELASSKDVKNILIIGSDARGDVSGMRSDTMILASIDTKNKQLKLTSFLRDCLVYIPALKKWNKLNAACSYGGADMVIDTIEYNFKVKIDNYVLVDFEIFTDFINALGGVTVDGITKAEVDWLKRNVKGIGINEGTSHLTGGAALWYCRVRKIDSDFKRTERQRKVIGAVIEQIKHTNPMTTFNAVSKVMPKISTDVNKNDLIMLGINAVLQYMNYDMYQAQVPAAGTWWDARYSIGQVLEMKIDKNAEILNDFVFGKQVKEESKDK